MGCVLNRIALGCMNERMDEWSTEGFIHSFNNSFDFLFPSLLPNLINPSIHPSIYVYCNKHALNLILLSLDDRAGISNTRPALQSSARCTTHHIHTPQPTAPHFQSPSNRSIIESTAAFSPSPAAFALDRFWFNSPLSFCLFSDRSNVRKLKLNAFSRPFLLV